MSKTEAISIDFGTCFSSGGYVNGSDSKALKPRAERDARRIPSAFYCDGESTFYGTKALQRGKSNPQCLVEYIKKKMDEPGIALNGRVYEPREIVSGVMKYILEGAKYSLENEFAREVTELKTVLTVPVSFSEPKKKMICDAFQEASRASGIKTEVLAVIPEPVAAAIEYMGLREEKGKTVLVYDLGGGTFDTAIVRSTPENEYVPYEVVGQDGRGIGGNDWDERMLELMHGKLREKLKGISGKKQDNLLLNERHALLHDARRLKEELSEVEEVFDDIHIQGSYYSIQITRKEFDDGTADLLDQTMQAVRHLLKRYADIRIDGVILAGGSAYMPQVMEAVRKLFPDTKIYRIHPELAISFGAARYAKMLSEKKPREIALKATHTYGIGYLDQEGNRKICNMIFRDDALPVSVSHMAKLPAGGKNSYFAVFESACDRKEETADCSSGEEIMSVGVWRTEALPENSVTIETLTLNKNNILEISVRDKLSGDVAVTRRLKIRSILD